MFCTSAKEGGMTTGGSGKSREMGDDDEPIHLKSPKQR